MVVAVAVVLRDFVGRLKKLSPSGFFGARISVFAVDYPSQKMWNAENRKYRVFTRSVRCGNFGKTGRWKRKTSVEKFRALKKNMRKNNVRKCGLISFKHSLQAVFNREKKREKPLRRIQFLSFSQSFPQAVENFIYRLIKFSCAYVYTRKNVCGKISAFSCFFKPKTPALWGSALEFLDKGFYLMLEGCIHFHIVFNNVDGRHHRCMVAAEYLRNALK